METSMFITELGSGLKLHIARHQERRGNQVKKNVCVCLLRGCPDAGFLKLTSDLSDVWRFELTDARAQNISHISLCSDFTSGRNSV